MSKTNTLAVISSGKGRVSFLITVLLLTLILGAFAVNASTTALTASNLTPANGSTIETSTPTISAYIKSTSGKIDANSVKLLFNNTLVSAKFTYKGHWEYDSCGNPYYVIDSYYEGTVEYKASNLLDGNYSVDLTIADVNKNTINEKWSFNVGRAPKFTNLTPVKGDIANYTSGVTISAKVTDDVGVAADTVSLKVYHAETGETSQLAHTYEASTGLISYKGLFADGVYTAYVAAKDTAGNTGTANWTFRISNDAAPQVVSLSPGDGGISTVRNPKISLGVKDTFDNLDSNSATLKIDGTAVTPTFTYTGHWEYDSCYGDYYVIDSYQSGSIEYQTSYLKDGTHTAEANIKDIRGNIFTKSWTFTVSTKPTVLEPKPAPSFISNQTPTITAKVTDVDPDDGVIKMYINGVEVSGWTFNATTSSVVYTPGIPLENEKEHVIKIDASDMGGSASLSWRIHVNTYPDMSDSNINNCSTCHSYDTTDPIPFQAMHDGVYFYGSHSYNSCYACHNYISYPDDCLQCHGVEDGYGGWVSEAPHGSSPQITYQLKGYDPNTPIRVTANREMWDCIVCHQPGSPVLGWEGSLSKPTRQLNNHNIPELHKTTDTSCVKCHALSLTREHARDGRVDKNGQPINCNTCHQSTDATIKAAITNNDKNCTACHANADHQSLHELPLNGCNNCHVSAISTEHSNRGYSCATCHDSTSSTATFAIKWNQKVCSNCHQESVTHKVNFASSVPADLPKYSTAALTLDWLNPEKLTFWLGEAWVPTDVADGMYTMSARNSSFSGTDVYDFYTTKMVEQGWTKVAGANAASNKFELVYTKGDKKAYIRYYNTLRFDTTEVVTYGSRIELLYN